MREQMLEHLHDNGPKTCQQIADALQADIHEVSNIAVELLEDGLLYLETADWTLWYVEEV